jgi:hypothetical protein
VATGYQEGNRGHLNRTTLKNIRSDVSDEVIHRIDGFV